MLAGSRARGGRGRTVRAGGDPYAEELYGDADFDVVDAVTQVAKELDVSQAQVALAWLLGKPAVAAPIVGATRLEHVEEAIEAVDVGLSADDITRLEDPYRPHSVLGHS